MLRASHLANGRFGIEYGTPRPFQVIYRFPSQGVEAQKGPFWVLSALALVITLPLVAISLFHAMAWLGWTKPMDPAPSPMVMIMVLGLTFAVLWVQWRLLYRSVYCFEAQQQRFIKSWRRGFRKGRKVWSYAEIEALKVEQFGDPDKEGPFLSMELRFRDGSTLVLDPKAPYVSPDEVERADAFLKGTGLELRRTERQDETRINRHLRQKGYSAHR